MTDVAVVQALKLLLKKQYDHERYEMYKRHMNQHFPDDREMQIALSKIDDIYRPVLFGLEGLIDRD